MKIIAGIVRGQSSETKPTIYRIGTKFEELDTGRIYIWNGTSWQYWTDTEERKSYIAQQNNGEGSPFIRLTGDEFATTAESSLYLLENINSAIGGGVLTNNNGVTFVEDGELPLRGYTVANFVHTSSQYLSRATESQFEVGTGSFVASVLFQAGTTPRTGWLIAYGDLATNEQNWGIFTFSDGRIYCVIDDGTNTIQIGENTPIGSVFDGRWHHVAMLVDKTVNIMILFLDGKEIQRASIASVTNTLNNSGENFYFGVRKNTSLGEYFSGRLSNFHLIKAADYNAVKVLAAGIRERVAVGGWAVATGSRFNTLFQNSSSIADGNYATTVFDCEDGEYDLILVYETNVARPMIDISVDDNVIIKQLNTYSATQVLNNSFTVRVKLGAGKHILKTKNNGKDASSTNYAQTIQFFTLVKRKGHENGGCTEFLLLGDELVQRENAAWKSSLATATADYYNNRITEDTNGDYTEGDLFIKGGLWRIELYVREDTTNAGRIDLDFGSVEVFDQLVTNASSNIVSHTRNVRLNQGKNNVRLAVVTGTGTPVVRIMAIRGVRLND